MDKPPRASTLPLGGPRVEKVMEMTSQCKDKSEKKWPYIVGLTVTLGSEFLIRDVLLPKPASDIHIGIAISIEWFVLLVLMTYWIPKVESKNRESVGLGKFHWRYMWLGAVVYLVVLVASMISGFALEALGLESIRSLQPMIKEYSFVTLVGLFLTGTFVEEVFYRGYLIERIKILTGQMWLAGVVSWLAFTLVHLRFFGLGPTIDVSVLAAALVLLYLKEKSIWPCIVVHGINGVFAYVVFPLLVP